MERYSGGGCEQPCLNFQISFVCFVSRVFQRVNDLPPTGELDGATLDVMRQPRCGMEDPFNKKHHKYRVMGESRETLLQNCQQVVYLYFCFAHALKPVIDLLAS